MKIRKAAASSLAIATSTLLMAALAHAQQDPATPQATQGATVSGASTFGKFRPVAEPPDEKPSPPKAMEGAGATKKTKSPCFDRKATGGAPSAIKEPAQEANILDAKKSRTIPAP